MTGQCAICQGELRVTSMTAAGVSYACPCGRTRWTQLTEGSIAFGTEGTTGAEGVTLERVPKRPDLKLVPPPEDAA